MAENLSNVFRKQALEYRSRPQHEGHLLQLSPAWIRWAYWLLVAVCGVGFIYALIGHVNEYAAGPAIIKVEGRTDLTARAASTVHAVAVQPGQRVAKDAILVRLDEVDEAANLHRIEHEFKLQLVKTLRDPADTAARTALTSLRAERELAQARLEERLVRAPHAGFASDVRIRPGQHLAIGDPILSLVAERASFRVVAMLPGHYRPLLRKGMPLRFEINGYPYAYQRLTVNAIGDEVVGPGEVRRYLGQEVADTFTTQGSLVLVEAYPDKPAFVAEGRELEYYNGMQGRAEVSVRSESILVTLVPPLRALLRYGRF